MLSVAVSGVALGTIMNVRKPAKGADRIRAGVWGRDFPAGKAVHIDDIRLFRLPD